MYSNLKKFGKFVSRPTLGTLCHFAYDAKLKHTLPYWDMYPLVIIADYQDGNRVLGYNMHYVPYGARKQIMDQLWKHMEYQPQARIKANYYYLKGLGMIDMMKPCIHSYLYTHMQSQFLEINPINWYKVLKIPSAVWAKGKPYRNAK